MASRASAGKAWVSITTARGSAGAAPPTQAWSIQRCRASSSAMGLGALEGERGGERLVRPGLGRRRSGRLAGGGGAGAVEFGDQVRPVGNVGVPFQQGGG